MVNTGNWEVVRPPAALVLELRAVRDLVIARSSGKYVIKEIIFCQLLQTIETSEDFFPINQVILLILKVNFTVKHIRRGDLEICLNP